MNGGLRQRARIGVAVPMPDGAALATDVYLPAGGGKAAAVLLRTYLGKSQHLNEALGWTRHGFACVVQDVRGRYESEGIWHPFENERTDGAATLEWLAGQDFFDGRAAAAGGSYGAFAAWAAALSGHPCLRAVISSVPAMRPVGGSVELGGILPLLGHLAWWTTHGDGRCARTGLFEAMAAAEPDLLLHLPLASLPERLWADLPGWLEAAAAEQVPISDDELRALKIASLHLGGWHDPFVGDTLRHFALAGADARPRPPRRLLVGPWTHQLAAGSAARYGERDYGERSRFALGRFEAKWLRGVFAAAAPGPAVTYFVLGGNGWAEAESWPPPEAGVKAFYAETGGRLLADRPRQETAETFVYDPADPFPARRTPIDERDLAGRGDLVRYTTEPFAAPCTLLGTPRLRLWATTAAPGADWVARLLEVTAEGRLLFLAFGAIDAGRDLARRGRLLAAGKTERYEIAMTPLAFEIPAGHRLRLEITSSAFPTCARNLNTGESRLEGSHGRPARQQVHQGGARSTALLLPAATGLRAA